MRRLLILINDLDYFLMHRAHVARAAQAAGWEVEIAVPGEASVPGLVRHRLEMERGRAAPLSDWRYMRGVRRLLERRRPDLVHAITIKPVLLGGMALANHARRGRAIPLVATLPGLGHTFSGGAGATKAAVEHLYRRVTAYRESRFTFETAADREHFVTRLGLDPAHGVVVAGTGIDRDAFQPAARPAAPFRILFAGRLLWSKGLRDVLDAARTTAGHGNIEWLIAGWRDPGNPDSLGAGDVAALAAEPVHFLGKVEDMASLLAGVHAVACPSRYGEGVPRILIEAAASGAVPIVTDFAGARAIVGDGSSGIVLAEPIAASLADAALRLAADPALAKALGTAARARVETGGFGADEVAGRFLEIFDALAPGATAREERPDPMLRAAKML